MTGRLRWVLAAAFVALFLLLPTADPGRIAILKTRAWLRDGALATALGADPGRPVPPLVVDLRQQGVDAETSRRGADEIARAAREWARGQGREHDAGAAPIALVVLVGRTGFRSELLGADGAVLTGPGGAPLRLEVLARGASGGRSEQYHPDRWSLLPAFLAIVVAIVTRRVLASLLLGCLAGGVLFAASWPAGAAHFATSVLWDRVLFQQFNLEIVGFVVFLFMAVGVMARCGGIQGLVDGIRGLARGPISAQLCSLGAGVLIFFDDYTNCIVVGSTMRPITDANRVSREKLAYIVDSTAAPIAGVSLFSTWIAYEVSTFAPQLPEVTRADGVTPYREADGFAVFAQTLPFRFYCVFAVVLVLLTIVMRREYGPMLAAERRARAGKPLADDARPLAASGAASAEPAPGAACRACNAVLPVLVLVLGTLALMTVFGIASATPADLDGAWWQVVAVVLGNGQSQRALCIASAAAFVLAVGLAVGQRILSLREALASALRTAHSLVFAILILLLAWSLGEACKDLGTAQFLTAAIHGNLAPWLLPAALFSLSALIAFSTGTSFGTMAILLPNVVVLAHAMGGPALMIVTIGAVLEGSIFGDHVSPISDTTVLSSVGSGSDHLHHVRTQAPYACAAMLIALLCGYVPIACLGPSAWPWCWALGLAALVLSTRLLGTDPDAPARAAT